MFMKNNLTIKRIVSISLMTAVICAISPFAITLPISPVPISLSTFAIYLAIIILGGRDALISVALYVMLGFVGLPVFTGFTGGAGKIMGPTGGYIIGYMFLAIIEGAFDDAAYKNRSYDEKDTSTTNIKKFLGMLLGTGVLYIFGSLWLAKQANMSLIAAFSVGIFPFVVGDVVKMLFALFIGTRIRRALIKNNLI